MKLRDLIEKLDTISNSANPDMAINGVSYDTRTMSAGDIFVAIRGLEFDGHKFIDEAINKGAACIVCEKPSSLPAQSIVVKDSRKALALMSATWFSSPSEKLKIIGVTGTNGKTTVTTIIKCILEICSGRKVGLIGTNGNYIGSKELPASLTTPESFEIHKLLRAMVDEGCEYVVMEVSSHALSLDRVYGMLFEIGVFTNLSPEHLDFHKTMDEYAKAKSLLFSISRRSVVNIDDEYAAIMTKSAADTIFTYSTKDQEADLLGKDIQLKPNKVMLNALANSGLHGIELNIPGMFSVYNALAAISATLLVGYDIEKIAVAIKSCIGAKGRVEVVPINADFTVIIDYAHTPEALKSVISMAQESASGRVVTLFGCGGDRDKTKRPLMGQIAAEYSDFVVVTSDNPRTENPDEIIAQILEGISGTKTPYKVMANRREAIYWALDNSKTNDMLILAGKGHETYQIIGTTKNPFDEREVVAEYFNHI